MERGRGTPHGGEVSTHLGHPPDGDVGGCQQRDVGRDGVRLRIAERGAVGLELARVRLRQPDRDADGVQRLQPRRGTAHERRGTKPTRS